MHEAKNQNEIPALAFETRVPDVTGAPEVPGLDNSTKLDRLLSKLCGHIKSEGLASLYWVSGAHTVEIADGILTAMPENIGESGIDSDSYVIVSKPGDAELLEAFESQYGFHVLSMNEIYADSFIIVNESAVLDLTPIVEYDGDPEFSEDPAVVSLYTGLFNILKHSATS